MKKVLISTTTFGRYDKRPLAILKRSGYAWKMNPYRRKISPDEVVGLAGGVVGIIAGTEPLNKAVLHRLPQLKAISRCGVGLDSVDVNEAKKLGIKVTIAGNGIAQAVSELVLGLTLNLIRQVSFIDRQLRDKRWNKIMGALLKDKRVGIIGLGRIGTEVARKFRRNDAEVVYYDPYITRAKDPGIKKLSLKALLKSADIVTLHLSSGRRNLNFISRKELNLMKKTAFLVNCSRGGIVNEKALYMALKKKKIAGAALDVFEKEPYTGPLRELENVILTPHIGSYAKESRVRMETQAVENLIRSLK